MRIEGETNWEHTGPKTKNNAYDLEHVALFDAIRGGKTINNGRYTVRSPTITQMGQFSCYTGKEVRWQQMQESSFHYAPEPEECREGMDAPVKPGPDGMYPVFVPGETKLP